MAKHSKVALIYDFDETLSTTYMQDYILIPALGDKPDNFWKKANAWSKNIAPTKLPEQCIISSKQLKKKA